MKPSEFDKSLTLCRLHLETALQSITHTQELYQHLDSFDNSVYDDLTDTLYDRLALCRSKVEASKVQADILHDYLQDKLQAAHSINNTTQER